MSDFLLISVTDFTILSYDTRLFDNESDSFFYCHLLWFYFILKFFQCFLSNKFKSFWILFSLEHSPHQSRLQWSDFRVHVMSMQAKSCLQSQRVSWSQSSPLQEWILEQSLSDFNNLRSISCNLKSIFSCVSRSGENVLIAIEFRFEVRHEGNLRKIDILEDLLKNLWAFWSLNSNKSIIIEKLSPGHKLLFFN